MSRPRILLIAEMANPEWTSVPLVGWSHASALARVADVHLVTQVRNRNAILRAGLKEGCDFTAIDSEAVLRPVRRAAGLLGGREGRGWTVLTAATALYYPYFEHLVWKRFARSIASGEFDVVHRLTPVSPVVPSPIAARCRRVGVPFVLGPLNGGVPWPKGFDGVRKREWEWLSCLRGASRCLPGYHATRRNAAAILVASIVAWKEMHRRYHVKCVYMPENAVDPARFSRRRERRAEQPLRVVFVGRLVPLKAVDVLLEAAAPLVRAGRLTVEIIGDGPEMSRLQEIIRREQLGDGVTLAGWVPHEQVQHRLAQADLLGFPSIREFGGGVVLEAMAVGLVPIVVNYGGPGELVTDETGFRVSMGPRSQLIDRFRHVLANLIAAPHRIDQMSPAAVRRVHEHFTWTEKAGRMMKVYEWVLGRASRPEFAMPLQDLAESVPAGALCP